MPPTVLPVLGLGQPISYTPPVNVLNGDVVVNGSLLAVVTPADIPAGVSGLVQTNGVFTFPKSVLAGSGAALAFGTPVYWDAVKKIASPDSTVGLRIGLTVPNVLPLDADLVIRVLMLAGGAGGGPGSVLQPAKFTSINVAGPSTASIGDITGAAFTVLKSTNAAPGTYTTRTAAQMFTDIPGASVGLGYWLRVINTGAGTLTLAGGTNVTLTGTMTVTQNTTRDFVVVFTDATHATIQDVGTGTES
jgi:predicted RecA/RadA family phage recombinase